MFEKCHKCGTLILAHSPSKSFATDTKQELMCNAR